MSDKDGDEHDDGRQHGSDNHSGQSGATSAAPAHSDTVAPAPVVGDFEGAVDPATREQDIMERARERAGEEPRP